MYNVLREHEGKSSHVIFRGAGNKAFSAGGDVKKLIKESKKGVKEVFANQLKSFELVSTYKRPFVAIMDGITMGGAAPFSIAGKYRVATERTVFAMPETAIGFFNDAGASFFLPRLRLNIGVYIGMTGARIKGYDVKKVGLASHYVESSRLEDLEKALLACKSDDEIGKAVAKLTTIPASVESELDLVVPRIDQCFDGDTVEEIFENLHLDGSDWAMDTIRTLNKMSPTALKVTHRSINQGKKLSLQDCLKTEFRLAINTAVVLESDFKEGVRALLIDKDFKPKWNPKKLHDVTDEQVEKYFGPLPDKDELVFESR